MTLLSLQKAKVRSHILCEIARKAMVENNPEFLQLLLNNGLKFSGLVMENGLYELHKQVSVATH